jgi:hypothetical protein
MKTIQNWVFLALFLCAAQTNGSDHPKKAALEPTLAQHIIVGGAAGVTEVAIMGQITSYLMNQKIQGKSIAKNPLHWYRGGLVNAASMAPITAIQKATDAYIRAHMKTKQRQELSSMQKMTAAFVAGATGALVSTPTEAIPVYMQKPENIKKTVLQASKDLKILAWRGLSATAMRDGLFTIGYMALAPIMQEKAEAIMGQSPASTVVGGIGGGLLTALITQPFAVVKTALQADPYSALHKNSFNAIRKIYAKEGLKGFFKGLTARGARIMVAIPVLTKAGEFYTTALTHYK